MILMLKSLRTRCWAWPRIEKSGPAPWQELIRVREGSLSLACQSSEKVASPSKELENKSGI